MPRQFPLDSTVTKAQKVFIDLRSKILHGMIAAESRLTLRPLAKHYGIGINAVSEAMKALAAEGLVELEGQAGARVIRRDLNRIRGEHILRIAIECESARRCATVMDESQLAILGRLATEIDELYAAGDHLLKCHQLDVTFHLTIAEFSGILPLRTALEPLLERLVMLDQTRGPSIEYPAQKHGELFEALCTRDPEIASRRMRQHCEISMTLSLEACIEVTDFGRSQNPEDSSRILNPNEAG